MMIDERFRFCLLHVGAHVGADRLNGFFELAIFIYDDQGSNIFVGSFNLNVGNTLGHFFWR